MEFLLLVIVVIAAAPYVVAPFRVHQRRRQHPRPSLVPFDPAKHSLEPGLSEDIERNVTVLVQAGFSVVADLFRAHETTRMRGVLMDDAAGEVALVFGVFSVVTPQRGVCSVEFTTRFEGERSFSVLNNPPAIFGAIPGDHKERFRIVRDPERLFRVYQALLARWYATARRERRDYRTDPAGFLAASMIREMREQVDTGYLWLDPRADAYRPTWKGAFLMSWKLMSPIREIREWMADRRARALLRDLRLEGPDADPIPARRRPSVHWNWIALVSAVVLLLIRPAWLDRLGVPGGRSERVGLPENFRVPEDFSGAVRALERLAGAGATPLVVQDSSGEPRPTAGVAVPIPGPRAAALVSAARDSFLAKGFYLFRVVQHFSIQGAPDTVALYPSRNRYEILRLIGTNGANYGIGPDSIVAWLEALEREQPFILTGIGFDWLEGRFATPIADADALARRFNAFCPDIVTQGTETVAALARELRRTARLYCWWD